MSESVVIAGVSTRAAAESAARAGFRVTAVDAYADLDQHPAVRALSLPRDFGRRFSPSAAATALRGMRFDAAVYLSSFENHHRAVSALTVERALWGNGVDVLRRVRDPRTLFEAFRRHGFGTPDVRGQGASQHHHGADAWLVKPLASGGGQGVRPWRGRVPRGHYLQQLVTGLPSSVVFVANGRETIVLGVSRQLVGDRAFGARGYRYCGSILTGAGDLTDPRQAQLRSRAGALARAAAEAFGLVGVNGVDFIARDWEPVPIEVNPRWSASMELVERRHGISVFGAHAEACRSRALPGFDCATAAGSAHAVGKAIVFARHAVVVGETQRWLDDPTVRDVPHPGERIAAGHPVCTVFAAGRTTDDCYRALVERADRVYEQLAAWAHAAA